MRGDWHNSSDSACFASGVRAGCAAALLLAVPILLLGWYLLVDREAARRQTDFGDFLLARAVAGGLVLSLVFSILVREAAERASGATSLVFYLLAIVASGLVGVVLTGFLLNAARWIPADSDQISIALAWVAGPWVCGGILPMLFRRRLEE